MSTVDDSFSDPRLTAAQDEGLLRPSDRTCRWALCGLWAVLAAGALWVTSSVLELVFWDREGMTPDVVLGYLAILPELIVLGAWLALAREVGSGGLWKTTLGYYVSFWLMGLLYLVMDELLLPWANTTILIIVGLSVVALIILLFTPKPEWDASRKKEKQEEATDKSDGDGGCLVHIIVFGLLFLVRGGLRKLRRKFPKLQFGPDLWTILGLIALGLLMLTFGIGQAVAKIRLRQRLGNLAAWLGATELLFIALHVVAVIAFVVFLAVNIMGQPQLNDDDVDKLMDPWLKTGTIVSAVCHGIWTLLSAIFFSSIRGRGELDWRSEFLFDNKNAESSR